MLVLRNHFVLYNLSGGDAVYNGIPLEIFLTDVESFSKVGVYVFRVPNSSEYYVYGVLVDVANEVWLTDASVDIIAAQLGFLPYSAGVVVTGDAVPASTTASVIGQVVRLPFPYAATIKVKYGTTSGELTSETAAQDVTVVGNYTFTLEGLTAETQYYYQVVLSTGAVGDEEDFTTTE